MSNLKPWNKRKGLLTKESQETHCVLSRAAEWQKSYQCERTLGNCSQATEWKLLKYGVVSSRSMTFELKQ